jgi:UPF0716 protein FxsA
VYWRLFSFFITVSILELLDIWFVSSFFFGLPALLLTAAAAVAAAFPAAHQFSVNLKYLNQALDCGETPAVPFMNLVLLVSAIILLLLPGLISDIIAVLLLVPPVRYLIISHILLRFNAYRNSNRSQPQNKTQQKPDIIDI